MGSLVQKTDMPCQAASPPHAAPFRRLCPRERVSCQGRLDQAGAAAYLLKTAPPKNCSPPSAVANP
jgi:hypothetical protein